jgi:hypothetical protein
VAHQTPEDIDIRAIDADQLASWVAALDASFLIVVPAGAVDLFRELYVPGRSLGTVRSRR